MRPGLRRVVFADERYAGTSDGESFVLTVDGKCVAEVRSFEAFYAVVRLFVPARVRGENEPAIRA